MEMVFHTCFTCRRNQSPSTNINEPDTLFSSLITDIERLKTSLAGDSISLKWCSEAINLLRKMHFQFLLFLEKSNVPGLWDGIHILDEYMKQTLDLLDLCNSLKSAISGMQRYRLMIEFAVGKLYDDGIEDATTKTEIERLEGESKKIYGVEKWKDMNLFKIVMPKTKSKDSSIRFSYAIKSTMRLVGMLLFSALFYPVSITTNKEVYSEYPQLKSFSVSIGMLVGCFLKVLQGGKDKSRPVLAENRVIEKAVLDIKAQVLKGKAVDQEKLRKSIDLLKQSSLDLKDGMEMFESALNELFEEVVNGRNKALDMVNAN